MYVDSNRTVDYRSADQLFVIDFNRVRVIIIEQKTDRRNEMKKKCLYIIIRVCAHAYTNANSGPRRHRAEASPI